MEFDTGLVQMTRGTRPDERRGAIGTPSPSNVVGDLETDSDIVGNIRIENMRLKWQSLSASPTRHNDQHFRLALREVRPRGAN